MTYRLQMAGEAKRLDREEQTAMAVAWHAGTLERSSPYPTFAKFTGIKPPPVKKQTPAQMKGVFAAMREETVPA